MGKCIPAYCFYEGTCSNGCEIELKESTNPLSFQHSNLNLENFTSTLAKAVPTGTGILTAAVLIPNKTDFQGHIYSASEIADAQAYFMKHRKIGVEHSGKLLTDVDIMDSRILDRAEDFDGQSLPAGTWVMSVHIEDPALWLKVESGEINGFSIQGKAKLTVTETTAIAELYIPFEEATQIHTFGSTQFNLAQEHKTAVLAYAQKIPQHELAENGVDTSPHITVKYGLHTDDPNEVQNAVTKGPNHAVSVMFGKTHVFHEPERDVLHVDVNSPGLHELNAHLDGMLDNTNTFSNYHPHVTIAFLKPGMGKKYEGDSFLAGKVHSFYTLIYNNKWGDQSYFTMLPPNFV